MNYQKNIKILNGLEKAMKGIAGEGPFSFEIKGRDGKLTEVSKQEFARWMVNEKNKDSWVGGVFSLKPKNSEIEGQKNEFDDKKQVEKPKESLVYGVKWDIDGSTYFMEKNAEDSVFKESYYQPRNEEEKKQIIERNQRRRKQELEENKEGLEQQIQNQEISPSSDKKDQKSEKEVNQQDFSHKADKQESAEIKINDDQQSSLQNKNNNQNIYYGVGVTSLVLLLMSMAIVWVKKQ